MCGRCHRNGVRQQYHYPYATGYKKDEQEKRISNAVSNVPATPSNYFVLAIYDDRNR